MSVSLDALRRKQIERRREQTRDYRVAMRLSTLLWHDEGKAESEITLWACANAPSATGSAAIARKGWMPSAPSTTRAIPGR